MDQHDHLHTRVPTKYTADQHSESPGGGIQELSTEFEPSKPIGPGRKDVYHLQELTINKLKFDSLGLIGRKSERECLKRCYRRMMGDADPGALGRSSSSVHSLSSNNSFSDNGSRSEGVSSSKIKRNRELVFIQGPSGVGKTTMANTVKQDVTREKSGVFVTGKFDMNYSEEPYSAIVQAFGQICIAIKKQQVMRKRRSSMSEDESIVTEKVDFGTYLVSALGAEANLLAELIPELEMLVPDLPDQSPEPAYDAEAQRNRWTYCFRVLMRAMCSCFSPIVMVLDDLQWADASSLEVMESLISDEENDNALMIIGCFRPEPVGAEHYLTETEKRLSNKVSKYSFNITSVELENLTVDETQEMIMKLINDDDEVQARGLAVICHERTLGNPYFLITFLAMLEEDGMIEFQFAVLQWLWNDDDISFKTRTIVNVVELLQLQMRKLPRNVQLLMQYAACLGSSIRLSTLEILWEKHAMAVYGKKEEDLSRLFGELEDANFIEYCGVKSFRFVHDKIKEAALTLATNDIPSFQYGVGSTLYRDFGANGLDELLFDVTDLMNRGVNETSCELAELNLKAAEKAFELAAFHTALKYASKGVDLLPTDKWKSHHDISVKLYTIGAKLSYALRQRRAFDKFSNEILSEGTCSEMDMLPVIVTKIMKLYMMDQNVNDSIDLCLDVLAELGLPRWNSAMLAIGVSVPLLQAIQAAKGLEEEHYQALPIMEDPKLLAIVHVLVRLTHIANAANKSIIVVLCTTQIVKLTLKYGVSPESSLGFVNLGLFAASEFEDYKVACFFAEVGSILQEMAPSKYSEADMLSASCQLAFPHTKSFSDCLSPSWKCYQLGMQSGNTNGAMWGQIVHSLMYPYQMGKPLDGIVRNCTKTSQQTQDLRQKDQNLVVRMFGQMVFNLTGKSKGTTKFCGSVFDEEKFQAMTTVERAYLDAFRLQLLIFFGEYKEAGNLAQETRGLSAVAPGYFFGIVDTFFRGVALYLLAHSTRKRKHLQLANEIHVIIEKWAQSGNPNVQHYHLFLSAEQAVYDRNASEALALFRKAIVLATRTGHLHHAALFNERCAAYLEEETLETSQVKDDIDFRSDETRRLYTAWGALHKVELL